MQPIRLLGPAMLAAGIVCLGLAVARGEATAHLILVFPAISGSGPLTLAGILLAFVGFFVTFLFWPGRPVAIAPPEGTEATSEEARAAHVPGRRWGGVAFLGPFPIIFGSDPRVTRTMLLLGVLLFILLLAVTLFALLG